MLSGHQDESLRIWHDSGPDESWEEAGEKKILWEKIGSKI